MTSERELRAAADAWQDVDPDPETRAELAALVDHPDDLADRFGGRLTFGTAGLRGRLGAGPTRMNRVVVRMAARALGSVLADRGEVADGVAVGFDARRNSDVFALDTARVLAHLGIAVRLLDEHVPTPVLAHAVRRFGCGAGVMVTASHNPPDDNGYKVYWGDGAQIVPPVDAEIEDAIAAGGLIGDDRLAPSDHPLIHRVGADEQTGAYLDAAVPARPAASRSGLTVAYTALHGVGGTTVAAAFERAGFDPPTPVAIQHEPDGSFPTVSFPNPEEPGAMDAVLDLGTAIGADLVVANDPDADRLAAAVPDRSGDGWYRLTGDEVGALLGDHVLRTTDGADRLVASSLVSSSLLGRIADAAGVPHRATLTGFKWIMRAEADEPGRRLVFGYEEALGYAVSGAVRDKDGVTAAVAFADLVTELAADELTVLDRLDELATTHGLHATGQVSTRFDDDPGRPAALMAELRAGPPGDIAGAAVVEWTDLSGGDHPADIVVARTAAGDRVIFRPSGTEPKLKVYLEVVVDVGDEGVGPARTAARRRLAELSDDLSIRLR